MGASDGPDADVTGLLQAWARGEVDARDRLLPLVYQELRRRAAAYLRRAQGQPREVELLDLDRALNELAMFDARKSQLAELRFFGGLTLEETGHVLDLSVATIEREWQAARAWLNARLTGKPHGA